MLKSRSKDGNIFDEIEHPELQDEKQFKNVNIIKLLYGLKDNLAISEVKPIIHPMVKVV